MSDNLSEEGNFGNFFIPPTPPTTSEFEADNLGTGGVFKISEKVHGAAARKAKGRGDPIRPFAKSKLLHGMLAMNSKMLTRSNMKKLRATAKKVGSNKNLKGMTFNKSKLLNATLALKPKMLGSSNLAKLKRTTRKVKSSITEISEKRRQIEERLVSDISAFREQVIPLVNRNIRTAEDEERLKSLLKGLGSMEPQLQNIYILGLLSLAIKRNNLKSAKVLLEFGANPNEEDGYGYVPLLVILSTDAAHLLLRYGADPAYMVSYGAGEKRPVISIFRKRDVTSLYFQNPAVLEDVLEILEMDLAKKHIVVEDENENYAARW